MERDKPKNERKEDGPMKMLTDEVIERRMRRRLAKYGYTLHKSRKKGGGYTVTGGYYPDEPDGHYDDLMKLVDAVEAMEERFAQLEADKRAD